MADFRHRIAPGRFGYMEKTDFGMLPGELMPSWLRQIVDPGLQRIIEAGGDFARWIEGKHGEGVFPKLEQPMVYGIDPLTEKTVATGGTYRVEEPFKDLEFADASWYGKADLVINRGGNQVQIGDFKVKKSWNPTSIQADADKYLPQLSSYYHLHKTKYPSIEVAKDVATIYVSQKTAKFLRAAFDAGAINSQQLLDELASTGAPTDWRTSTDKFNKFKSGYGGDSSRQVLFHQAKIMEEEELKPYIQAEIEFSRAIEAATGHSRTELGSAFKKYGRHATPTAEDVPFWTEWYESLNYLASRYAAGQVTLGQVERGMARVQDKHGYGGARRFEDILDESLSKKPAAGEERVVERYNLNDNLRNWQPASDVIPGIPAGTPGMENVRVNPGTREIAIVYDDGSDFLSEYWRGQYDILPGGKVVIDGRLITPRQIESPNPLVPSTRWEAAANVLPRVLRTASALVPAFGGGSKAAKEVRNYMLRALEPMPSVGRDLLSVSAARMAYQASMVGILSDQYTAGQIESVLRAGSRTYAWRGQGRQAFDVAQYAHIPGWSYNPETGVLYAGEKPGKLEKRARQGLRHEFIFPVTRGESIPSSAESGWARKYTTTLDVGRMMFSPIVQRDRYGKASEYGAELGYRARAAVLGHSDVLPQGMAYTKGGMLGGIINRTIEIPTIADFTPLENIVRDEGGRIVIGYLNDDERTPVVLPLEGLDDFELKNVKLTHSGHTTRIDIEGLGSVKASSNLAKVWLGEKTMVAQANLAKMIGDPLARGADILLPRRKNIRQFAYQLVSAAYAKDPIGLAHRIYGVGNLKGNLAIGLTDREQALQGQYGIEHSGISVLMPIEEEHQKAFYRVAIEEAVKGLRENVQLRTPLSETTRLMFETANIPMRSLSPDEIVEAGGKAGGRPWYEVGVPAIYSELFMQSGIERTGDPQMSFEEIMNLVQDPSGYGEGYQKAIQEKVLPQIATWSGHARSVYHDVLKARMLSLGEAGAKPGADEVVTIEQLKDQLGDHDRSNLALRLKEATGLHGKFIQIGNMYLPPAETLAALSVVEDFKQNMPWVEGEEGKQLGIKAEQVSSLLSSLHNYTMRGSGRDYMSLREAFLGTGAGEKLGVGMTQALARGVMGAKLMRGAAERPVVSYDWLEDNQVLIGDRDLQQMFGPKFDLTKLNDALAVAGLIRRPITNVGRGGILAANIITTSQAREQGFDVPEDFDGVATSRYIISQLSGDFDADRIFALLMSQVASSGKEFSTDPTIKKAAELASLYSREAKDLASQMGFPSTSAALGRKVDEADLKPEDIFQLNLMYGRRYSEMAKSTEDLSKEQRVFADLVNKGARGLAMGIFGTEEEWMQRAPIGEVVDAILGSTHSQMEMQRGYNRLIRDVPAYMALTGMEAGSEEGKLQRLVAFRAYQQAVDKTLFSSGVREWMNLAEGYNPYRLQGRTYVKRLGPATPKGELQGEHLELMSSVGGFNVRAIQSILESEEYWGPMRSEEEEAFRWETRTRRWAGEYKPSLVAQQKAMAITSNPEMQEQIARALMQKGGADAQQIWELFGETGQERFANLWRDPGILAGPLGALVFAGMRRSAGQPVQPYMRTQGTAQQHERNMLDWGRVVGLAPEVLTLARTGESMSAISKGLSGKGRPTDIVDNLRALAESGMYGATSILEVLETEPIISRLNTGLGEEANLRRDIQPTEDELLAVAEAAGLKKEDYGLVSKFVTTIGNLTPAGRGEIFSAIQTVIREGPEQFRRTVHATFPGGQADVGALESYAQRVLNLPPMAATAGRGAVRAPQGAGAPGAGGDPMLQSIVTSGDPDLLFRYIGSLYSMAHQLHPERAGRQGYTDVRSWVTGEGWDEGKRGFPALAGLGAPEARREMVERVARGGLEPDMAQVIMAMRPELMTRGLPGALGRARGLREAGVVSGTPEYEQAMQGIMELAGMDVFPEELQNAADELKGFHNTLRETTPIVEEFGGSVSRFLELERTLRPGELREFQRGAMAIRRARGAAEAIAERGETPEERAAARQELARIGAIERQVPRLQQQQEGLLGPGGFPAGPAGGIARGLRQVTSGWELMRLQRMWSMTGGAVFQQMIPAAAQEQLAAMQAATAIGGAAPELPGGAGGGVMRYQAAQRTAMMRAGRVGYQAWSPFMQAAGPLRDTQAILGPAAGAGLVAGGIGTMLGAGTLGAGVAATTIGLPLTLGIGGLAGLAGGAGYAYRAGAPETENELRVRRADERMRDLEARRERGEGIPLWETLTTSLGAGWEAATTMAGGMMRGEPPVPYIEERIRAGEEIAVEPLRLLSSADRASMLSSVAESLHEMVGTIYEGFDPAQILQFISAEAGFFPKLAEMTGDEIEELFATDEFQNRLASGITGEAAVPIARAAGARPGTEQFQEIRAWFQALSRFEQEQVGREAEQLGPLQQRRLAFGIEEEIVPFGAAPEVLTGAVIRGTEVQTFREQLAQMTGSVERANATVEVFGGDIGGMRTFQRFMGGDPWAISRYASGELGPFGTAQVDLATARTFGGETPPEVLQLMEDLRPIIDTQTGLKVGVASFPGFSEQLAEGLRIAETEGAGARGAIVLPEGGVEDWVREIIEEGGTRGLQARQIGVQRGYQEWQWGQREQALDWQRVSQFGGQFEGFSTRGTFAIQRELRNLSRIWEDFTQDYQQEQRQLQFAQFMENWQVRAERMPVGFQWQREDLAFRGAQQTMQYGWGMEDIEEALRYATGRERRGLLRQQERATISYGMGMGQLDVQAGRIDVREQWAREDLERQKRHFLERFALQDEYQSRYRWYTEQRRALEDELQAIYEYGAMFNLEQAELALAKQQEIQAQLNAINDGYLAINQTQLNTVALAATLADRFNNIATVLESAAAKAEQILSISVPTDYDQYYWYNQ